MNWYKLIKFAQDGDYWVLPDGRTVQCPHTHTKDGWNFLKQIEPNVDPSFAPRIREDYRTFANRGWIRIQGACGVQLFNGFATPSQAKTIVSLLSPDMLIYFDLPNRKSILLPSDKTQLIENILTGKISPIQVQMRPNHYLPVS